MASFEDYDEFVSLRDKFLAIDLYSEPDAEQNREEDVLNAKVLLIVGGGSSHACLRTLILAREVQQISGTVVPLGSRFGAALISSG